MALKLTSFDDAIQNLSKGPTNQYGDDAKNDVLYSMWPKRHAATLGEFYTDFVEPRLPKPDVVLKWHNMLLAYSKMDGAIFPIRDGATSGMLRRGWLVRVDNHLSYKGKFSYMFTDNDLATYIYKLALDEYCPSAKEFFDFMTEFKDPANIGWVNGRKVKNDTYQGKKRYFPSMPVHFQKIGGSSYPDNTEKEKNAYFNAGITPQCPLGKCGYKLAHIYGVKEDYKIKGKIVPWTKVGLVELGAENGKNQDYQWVDKINNFAWDRKMKNGAQRDALREVVVAHSLRFLDPINHFLAPMLGNNKFTKLDGEPSLDIAEYENLLLHLMFQKTKMFGKVFEEYSELILSPDVCSADHGAEPIDIVYHENSLRPAHYKKKTKTTRSATAKVSRTSVKGSSVSGRDYSKYSLDGGTAKTKGQILIDLVQKHITDCPNDDVSALKKKFDKKLEFNKKAIILLENETTQKDWDDKKVYSVTLLDGTVVYINKQVQIGDIEEIIRIAKSLGYNIEQV